MKHIKLSPQYWTSYMYNIARSSGDRTKSLILGSGIMTISNIINILTRLILIALLTRIYTKDEFGLWISITSITSVMANSDFGVASALRNKLVECRVRENGDNDAKTYFFSVIYFFLVITLIISLLLLLFRHQIPYDHLFKTNDLLLKMEGRNILIWIPILLLINVPFGIGPVMLFAYQETKIAALLNIIICILGLLAIAIAASLHQSITITTILYFLVNLLCTIVGTLYFIYRRKWFFVHINIKSALPKVWELVTQGVLFFITQTSAAFLFNAATLVSTSQIGLSAASELSLAQRLYLLVVSIYAGVHNPLWAGFADAINRHDWHWCRTTILRIGYVTVPLFTLATLIFTFSGNFFLTIIAGKSYVSSKWLLLFMGIWTLFYLLYGFFLTFLSATGKIKLITFLSTLSAFFIFPIASFFAHKYGNIGIICISSIVFFLLSFAAYLQAFYIIGQQGAKKQIAI